jgi:hypothetical protein
MASRWHFQLEPGEHRGNPSSVADFVQPNRLSITFCGWFTKNKQQALGFLQANRWPNARGPTPAVLGLAWEIGVQCSRLAGRVGRKIYGLMSRSGWIGMMLRDQRPIRGGLWVGSDFSLQTYQFFQKKVHVFLNTTIEIKAGTLTWKCAFHFRWITRPLPKIILLDLWEIHALVFPIHIPISFFIDTFEVNNFVYFS